MEERMNKSELIKLIESLGIDYDEFWVLSSGSLVLRDVFKDAGDLDIAVTEKGLEQLKSKYDLRQKENGWFRVNDKVECILDNDMSEEKVEKYGKYNLLNIYAYEKWLKQSDREKDKLRLEVVQKYINENRK